MTSENNPAQDDASQPECSGSPDGFVLHLSEEDNDFILELLDQVIESQQRIEVRLEQMSEALSQVSLQVAHVLTPGHSSAPADSRATPAKPPHSPHSGGHAVVWLLVVLVLSVGVVAALLLSPWQTRWGKASVVVPQGTVQRIRFVATFGVSSQVDTEQRSFLVRGVTLLRQGARVQTRSGPLGSRLCDADSAVCDELMRDE
jgi:hypothetical protein